MNEIKATPGNCRGASGRRCKRKGEHAVDEENWGVSFQVLREPKARRFAAPKLRVPVGTHRATGSSHFQG